MSPSADIPALTHYYFQAIPSRMREGYQCDGSAVSCEIDHVSLSLPTTPNRRGIVSRRGDYDEATGLGEALQDAPPFASSLLKRLVK